MFENIKRNDLVELELTDGKHVCGRCIYAYPLYGYITLDTSELYRASEKFISREKVKNVVKVVRGEKT